MNFAEFYLSGLHSCSKCYILTAVLW